MEDFMDIISLYEDLRKYIDTTEYDDLFYYAPEGDAQIEIVKNVLQEILQKI